MADPSSQTPPDAEAPTEQSERARYLRTRLPVVSEGPVPARMINELLYCERLMYLEWVQGEWADNYFTADGTRVHKRTEKARPLKAKATSKPAKSNSDEASEGDQEEDEEEARPYQARSVWLTSQALGLTAKIDVVDVDGERVMPIEYKRGKKPKVAEGAWLPERAQVCAQVLLLREHDYRCDEAAIYYAGDRQRVPIEITQELIDVVLDSVLRARSLVSQATLPPPLVDSPKCQGCSLAGICLPDEVNLLAHSLPANETARVLDVATPASDSGHASAAQAPRRLYAARDDKLPLYVQEQGARLRLQGERLRIEGRDAPVEARLSNTSQVSLYGNVQVSTQALRELLTRNIPLSFFTTGGWLVGRATGIDGKNVELRKTQY